MDLNHLFSSVILKGKTAIRKNPKICNKRILATLTDLLDMLTKAIKFYYFYFLTFQRADI